MITQSTNEYNAFGPWVLEINDEHTMPPLFTGYYKEQAQPLMLIKIPRKIDRRDAVPGMHLYDYVIGAFDAYLYIMKRVRDGVDEKRVSYESVAAVKNTISLLKGQLSLYLHDEIVTIDYNTVSEPIMMKLINIIRERYQTQVRGLGIETISHDLDTVEHLYSVLIDHYKALDNKIRLVAYQKPSRYRPKYKTFKEKVKALLNIKKVITSTAFLTNDQELIVLQRDKRARGSRQGDLTYSTLFLPFASIQKVSMTKGADDKKLNTMSINVESEALTFLCGDNSLQIDELFSALKTQTDAF